ncbi:hypothetical protein BBP40_010891 [Aspergillus hancockii]|nr:hypothetical protein BBP40_010891 [Aspergillus hancockii]
MGSRKWLGSRQEKQGATRPKFVEFRSSRWFVTFVVSFASATDIFMYGLLVPVTPTALHNRVGIPNERVQGWTSILLALFSAALLALSPIVGYIADRSESRRWSFLFGLVGLGAATALLCVGTSIGLWVAGRLFQGAAAAVVWVVGITLMADTLGKDGLGQAIGYMAMAGSVGTLAGPLLGGVLYQECGYYAVFGLAFGLIGLDILLRLMLIERRHAIKWLAPEMRPLVATQNEAGDPTNPSMPTRSGDNQGSLKTSASQSGLGRVSFLLSSSRLIVALWGNFIIALLLSSFDSVLPLFVQGTFGWQQSGQGLIFLPLIVPHVFEPITGFIIDNFPRSSRYITAGSFLTSALLLILLRLVTDNSIHHKFLLCAILALLGLCFAVALPPLDLEVFHAVKAKEGQDPNASGQGGDIALAYGLTNMGFAAGSLVGPFFAGFIRQQAGWGTMGWALGLIASVSAIPTLLFMGGWILREPVRSEDGVQYIDSASAS